MTRIDRVFRDLAQLYEMGLEIKKLRPVTTTAPRRRRQAVSTSLTSPAIPAESKPPEHKP